MSFWDFTRDVGSVRLLVEIGHNLGMSAATLLRGTGLSFNQLRDPNVQVSASAELRVISNLCQSSLLPETLGFQAGLRYSFSTYGLWGFGLISSATLGDAMTLALRFLPLTYAFTLISFHRDGELGVLSFGEPELKDELKRFLVARDMAAAYVLMRELAGSGFLLERLTLRNPLPRHAKLEISPESFGGAHPRFGTGINSLAFGLRFLEHQLPQANPVTALMCAQQCSELLEKRRVKAGTAGIVRQYLSIAGSMPPDQVSMAKLMNTSERTFKRRLSEEGTSFRSLLMEVRYAMAKELLESHSLSMRDIAERLGFSDASSFSQAFKRWHGCAPQRYQKNR
ncbi:AraC family transcriptional regulator [Pseudomonas sp. Y39-6]|uniref:AraC family transcriptional regulator n=1 Tax=Pseudomonas TaxID=286 RepID=UPI00061DB5DB|nr:MULTISPECIES: AraC family transcriptional regulator [Pseudomonas]NWC56098.1 AraC family transcriptional regulator [Pseudomonas veronii]QPO20680.1 AraC family transcriptional regulator [Pseudomonas sp. Y39-6]URS63847.1 AraC family transcriptional regulator [Pseudomonas sp. Y39-6]